MHRDIPLNEFISKGQEIYLSSTSLDCVIFGFHDDKLKVLLLKPKYYKNKWALPGGFVFKDENLNDAAIRVLEQRTQLQDVFLQQFYVFGNAVRTKEKHAKNFLLDGGADKASINDHWAMKRFVTVGYYALVEYSKVTPQCDEFSSEIQWWDLDVLPALTLDHKQIVEKALEALRSQLNYQPIGYNLLAEEFTIKELQSIYETILGKKLDRRNFQRKILGYDILVKKQKLYTGGAHKAPFLYSFKKEKYFKSLQGGLENEW